MKEFYVFLPMRADGAVSIHPFSESVDALNHSREWEKIVVGGYPTLAAAEKVAAEYA